MARLALPRQLAALDLKRTLLRIRVSPLWPALGRILGFVVAPVAVVAAATALALAAADRAGEAFVDAELSALAEEAIHVAEAPVDAVVTALADIARRFPACTALAAIAGAGVPTPFEDLGLADGDGNVICFARTPLARPIALLGPAAERMPTLTLTPDARAGEDGVLAAWWGGGDLRLVAVVAGDRPALPHGPAFTAGALGVAIRLADGRLWRLAGADPALAGTELRMARADGGSLPLTAEVTLPADLRPASFVSARRAIAILGGVLAVAGGAAGFWAMRRRPAAAPTPRAALPPEDGSLRYRPVIRLADGSVIGIDLVEPEGLALKHPAVVAAALAENAAMLKLAPDVKLSLPFDVGAGDLARRSRGLLALLARLEVRPDQLVLVIDGEGVATLGGAKAAEGFATLRQAGILFAVEGVIAAGGLSAVLRVRPDLVSLDSGLFRIDAPGNGVARIVKAVTEMARACGAGVIARGMSEPADVAVLRAAGITSATGPVLGPSASAAALSGLAVPPAPEPEEQVEPAPAAPAAADEDPAIAA